MLLPRAPVLAGHCEGTHSSHGILEEDAVGTGSVLGSRLALVGSASPDPAPCSWLLPWQEGSGLRGAAARAIPLLPRCPASRCLSFPLELQPDCEEQPRVRVLNGSGWFLAAWMHVGEQSARPVGCKIAFLEAAHGPGD